MADMNVLELQMQDETPAIPVYFINGFLESGKTEFINFTIEEDYFKIDELTLIIACEEGENEYEPEALAGGNISSKLLKRRLQKVDQYAKLSFSISLEYLSFKNALKASMQRGQKHSPPNSLDTWYAITAGCFP